MSAVLLLEAGPDYDQMESTQHDLLDSRNLPGLAHDSHCRAEVSRDR